jgi:hypothetical protein
LREKVSESSPSGDARFCAAMFDTLIAIAKAIINTNNLFIYLIF